MDWKKSSKMVFKNEHPDLNGKTFNEVYDTRPEWVQFTLIWKEASGVYKSWMEYVTSRNKDERQNKPASSKS